MNSPSEQGTVGGVLHPLFQQALAVAKKVRTNTGIGRGHVSVSSVAVDYVRQVFDHFHDKTILVIGAGKMGELTLKHLRELQPQRILVANRSPDKAASVAQGCGGQAIAWEQLDDALVQADIVLSTTGAAEPIMTRRRFDDILARRIGRHDGHSRHCRAARFRSAHPRRRPGLPVQHRRSQTHPRTDAAGTAKASARRRRTSSPRS